MSIFNNREIAIAICFVIIVSWFLLKEKVRDSVKNALKTLSTSNKLIIPFLIMAAYVLGVVYLLSQVDLWKTHQIKNTIFWFFSVGLVSFFRFPKIANDPHYFKNSLRDQLRIIIILEFIVSFYTFNLVAELIFVPFMFAIGVMLAVAQHDKKLKAVEKFLNRIVEFVGIGIIVFTIYMLFAEFDELAKEQTFYDLLTPVVLSVSILPYLYFLSVYSNYEDVFCTLQFQIKNRALEKYAKKRAVINFNLQIGNLRRWANSLNFLNIHSTSDIDASFNEIHRLIVEKNNPPFVAYVDGWSPYEASEYLKDTGLKTGFYKRLHNDQWVASSPYLEIGEKIIPNNIAYYLEGDRSAVKCLKLKMNINNKADAPRTHQAFVDFAKSLHKSATKNDLSKEFKTSIMNGSSYTFQNNTHAIAVSKNDWSNENGYSMTFVIKII